ncbi:hypothetical protein JCM10908_001866 [Rhodotorula pacifica]|uniref:NmrA/HSCARG family protein n=1 Tax=Rhodotorula pacifica TaxID=1495444 RepID=UPI00317F02E1
MTSSTDIKHVITVVGATGNQGGGVVAALLRPAPSSSSASNPTPGSSSYHVRAVSSDPSGSKALALLAKHATAVKEGQLSLVQADFADVESLEHAFKGSYGVFFAGPFMPGNGAKAEESPEAKLGRNVVDAAKAAGVKHFIYSSSNNVSEISHGKYVNAVHADAKAIVGKYAHAQLEAATLLVPSTFYTNLAWPFYARRKDDGTVAITLPIESHVTMEFVDESYDIGNFAAAAFRAGPSVTAGKTYPVCSPLITSGEIAKEYERATGEKTVVDPASIEEVQKLVDSVMGASTSTSLELSETFAWFADKPDGTISFGAMKPEDDTSYADLGVKASSLAQFIERTGFRVPAASA